MFQLALPASLLRFRQRAPSLAPLLQLPKRRATRTPEAPFLSPYIFTFLLVQNLCGGRPPLPPMRLCRQEAREERTRRWPSRQRQPHRRDSGSERHHWHHGRNHRSGGQHAPQRHCCKYHHIHQCCCFP